MIVILAGGRSAEREVSLATAKSIEESLKRLGQQYLVIEPDNTEWLTKLGQVKATVVVIALHGPFGEDGTVQQLLEERGIYYTGSGVEAAAFTIDKRRTKIWAQDAGLTVPVTYDPIAVPNYPVIVKPNKQGSSFGVSIVRAAENLQPALELARQYAEDDDVIVEEYVEGTEVTCGVIDVFGPVTALPLVEIVPKSEFFDYNSKYQTESGCDEICPARVSAELTNTVQTLSRRVMIEQKISQSCRVDWIIRQNIPYFLEVNTLPGMTATSLLPKELSAAGIDFDHFIGKLIETAQKKKLS